MTESERDGIVIFLATVGALLLIMSLTIAELRPLTVVLLFGAINALRGDGKIGRIPACLLMGALLWPINSQWVGHSLLAAALLYFGFVWGWSFNAISGSQVRDWEKKFPPSKLVFKLWNPDSGYLYGVVGAFARFLCFAPALWVSGAEWWMPFAFSFNAAVGMYLCGALARFSDLHRHAVRIFEFFFGCLLGGFL